MGKIKISYLLSKENAIMQELLKETFTVWEIE